MGKNEIRGMIQNTYSNLRPSEKRVADYVLTKPLEAIYASMKSLAERCGCSDATVIRFFKKLGYSNYGDFRADLASGISASVVSTLHPEISGIEDYEMIKSRYATLVSGELNDTLAGLRLVDIEQAVDVVLASKIVTIYGWARSGYVAHILGLHLLAMGIYNTIVTDDFRKNGMAAMIQRNDAAIGISFTGDTDWVVDAMRLSKLRGGTTVCFTNEPHSPIVEHADVALFSAARKSPMGADAATSRLTQLALVDFFAFMISRRLQQRKENPLPLDGISRFG